MENNDLTAILDDDIKPKVDRDWWDNKDIIRKMSDNPTLTELHIFANVTIWQKCGLNSKEIEMVILSAASELDFKFAWHHHVHEAVDVGIDEREIVSIHNDYETFDNKHQTLMKFARMIVNASQSGVSKQNIQQHYTNNVIVGAAMLASYYAFIHNMADALNVELTEEFVGWKVENM